MIITSILQMTLSAITYYLYNMMYFRLVCNSQNLHDQKKLWMFVTFIVNFLIFYICSALQLSLVFNWIIFGFFIFLETMWIYHSSLMNAAFLALQGTICGLSANVLNRCFFAIILNKELIAFANDPSADGNIKSIPIIIGFTTTAIAFYIYGQEQQCKKLARMFHYPNHMNFLFKIMAAVMFCLLVHLVLYNYDANDLILKLWGLSSIVFVIVGYLLALNYTLRLCELEEYKSENEQLRLLVQSQQELEHALSETVYLDELTGFYNRPFCDQKLQEIFDQDIAFRLCFIDLNGLKTVNDQQGHSQGDRYILRVAEELENIREDSTSCFRYGGDEFILLFQEKEKEEILSQLNEINRHLRSFEQPIENSFHMSLSFGVVESKETDKVEGLIQLADSIMYEQKKKSSEGLCR